MAEPARKIRNVETTEDVVRPRDAAIRQAANDNSKYRTRYITTQNTPNNLTYENDNNNVPYPTVSESFNEYASDRTIQPNNNTSSSSIRDTATQYKTNVTTRNTTRQVKTDTRPTPNKNARPLRKPGLKRAIPNVPVLDVNPVKLARATTISVSNITWGMGLWASIQLPIAVLSIVLFGLTYMVHDALPAMVKNVTGELVYKGLSYIFSSLSDGVNWLLEKILGFRLDELLNPETYFVLTHMLVFVIGFATLILMGVIYQISLINCVFGKHTGLKVGTLIFATFAYMVPVLNILPWFLLWVVVVWRYPE